MLSIGVSYENITLDEILKDSDFYADQLLKKKVIIFRGIEITHEQHYQLINILYDGGINKKIDLNTGDHIKPPDLVGIGTEKPRR
jgi:hypothetical protein